MSRLISPAALAEERRQHQRLPGEDGHALSYGISGHRWRTDVLTITRALGLQTVLDYGCGTGTLSENLSDTNLDVRNYDPVTFPLDPEPAELVVCTDVLCFVEADRLEVVLDDLDDLAEVALLLVVPQHPPEKLKNQRDRSHYPLAWWSEKLRQRWPRSDSCVVYWGQHQGSTPRLKVAAYA